MNEKNEIPKILGGELDTFDHTEKYLSFKPILEEHKKWLSSGGIEGRKADLRNADLSGLSLYKHDLREIDFRGANLQRTNLKESNLYRARFEEANLQDVDLTGAKGLLASQLAGANVCGAQLPEDIEKFEGLKYIDIASGHVQKLFFTLISVCVYCWLTIAITTDVGLLTHTAETPLPIINTKIPIVYFYWAAPLLVLSIYAYFHIQLQRLWEVLVELPAIFPDGRSLPHRIHPWLLNGLTWAYFTRLKNNRPALSRLQNSLAIMFAWCIVPLTLTVFWLRYLRAHEWKTTYLHIVLLAFSAGACIGFSFLTAATLRRYEKRAFLYGRAYKSGALFLGTVFIGVALYFISLGAIDGDPHYWQKRLSPGDLIIQIISAVPKDQKKELKPADIIRIIIPQYMERLGLSAFANIRDADVSLKPPNWTGGTKDEVALVKGAVLKRKNLCGIVGVGAFLVNADLSGSKLEKSDLSFADMRQARFFDEKIRPEREWAAFLRGAKIQKADLRGADLSWVDLRGASLWRANLQGAKLERAKLMGADLSEANLQGASFFEAQLQQDKEEKLQGATLWGANLQGANLNKANLKGANLQYAKLKEAELFSADLREVKLLTKEQVCEARTWVLTYYSPETIAILELPQNHNDNVSRKDLSDYPLRNANLRFANLENVKLINADLKSADLEGANLQNADLQGADLRGASLRKAQLYGTKLKNAKLNNADLQEASLLGFLQSNGKVKGVDLEYADLRGANLKGTDLRGALGFTRNQLRLAIIDDKTKLPDYLKGIRMK